MASHKKTVALQLRTKVLALFLATSFVAAACSSGDDDLTATSSGRTIPEEVTVSTEKRSPTTIDFGPLPEVDWDDQEYLLQPLALLDQPMALTTRGAGDGLWVAERKGTVRFIRRQVLDDPDLEIVQLQKSIKLDIQDDVKIGSEGGLLGLAFSSDGKYLYVSYTNTKGNSVLAEYEMGLSAARPDTRRVLLEIDQPFENHNGGQITFGPDGFLYMGLGDGGSREDPQENGQDSSTLLGSILRIDPSRTSDGKPYAIPVDNPFVNTSTGLDEIWMTGLRNPWRFSFDALTRDLWVGDVGQDDFEEINYLPREQRPAGRGANLGWSLFEGNQVLATGEKVSDYKGPDPKNYVAPIHTYEIREKARCSVVGGYVYRSHRIAKLGGVYIFGDFCTGEIFGLQRLDDGRAITAPLQITIDESLDVISQELTSDEPDFAKVGNIVSFAEGPEGEIYVLESGRLSRLQDKRWSRETKIVDSRLLNPPDFSGPTTSVGIRTTTTGGATTSVPKTVTSSNNGTTQPSTPPTTAVESTVAPTTPATTVTEPTESVPISEVG